MNFQLCIFQIPATLQCLLNVNIHVTYVLCKIVARSPNNCCNENATMLSMCIIEPHSAVKNITISQMEPRNRPRRTHRVSGGIAQLFLNLGTRRGCAVSITPRPNLPPGKTRYPLYRRLGGPRSRSG